MRYSTFFVAAAVTSVYASAPASYGGDAPAPYEPAHYSSSSTTCTEEYEHKPTETPYKHESVTYEHKPVPHPSSSYEHKETHAPKPYYNHGEEHPPVSVTTSVLLLERRNEITWCKSRVLAQRR